MDKENKQEEIKKSRRKPTKDVSDSIGDQQSQMKEDQEFRPVRRRSARLVLN